MEVANRTPTELSNDLNTLKAEISAYQSLAGEAIFEIGRRLKHVKDNDLAHGKFMEWYTDLGMTKDFVSKSIKIAINLSGTYFQSNEKLGIEMLNQIATMAPEDREREYVVSSGEEKKVEDMTVKELREVKKQLKAEKTKNSILESGCKDIGSVKGVKAKKFVAELSKHLEYHNLPKPKYEYQVKNYFIDIYFPEQKLAFEYDEQHHKYQYDEDMERQNEIEYALNCKIIRLDETAGNDLNISRIILELGRKQAI